MIRKKVCMLGAFAVGKTSLVSRFVKSIFSQQYQAAIGVTIEKKDLPVGDQSVSMIIWDLAGETEIQRIRTSYLRGASGCVLVVDGTRKATLDTALALQDIVGKTLGSVPFIFLLNKCDLAEEWALDGGAVEGLAGRGWSVLRTSAKTGEGVEEAFSTLGRKMLP